MLITTNFAPFFMFLLTAELCVYITNTIYYFCRYWMTHLLPKCSGYEETPCKRKILSLLAQWLKLDLFFAKTQQMQLIHLPTSTFSCWLFSWILYLHRRNIVINFLGNTNFCYILSAYNCNKYSFIYKSYSFHLAIVIHIENVHLINLIFFHFFLSWLWNNISLAEITSKEGQIENGYLISYDFSNFLIEAYSVRYLLVTIYCTHTPKFLFIFFPCYLLLAK